jgi:hypothetical protein
MIPTIRVKSGDSYAIINQSDYDADPKAYELYDVVEDGEAGDNESGAEVGDNADQGTASFDDTSKSSDLPPIPDDFAELPWHELRALALKHGADTRTNKDGMIALLGEVRARQVTP